MKLIKPITADPFLKELGLHEDRFRLPYTEITRELNSYRYSREDLFFELLAETCEADFFLFCWCVLGLPVNHPYLLSRCYEIQDNCETDTMYQWAREHWKALSYDTPVLTLKGWKKHGELNVGDKVVGSEGRFVKVVARTKNFENSRQYEITFDKKYKIIASSDHLWEVNIKSRKRLRGEKNKRVGREKVLLTSDEIFEHGCGEDRKLSVDVAQVEYSAKKFKLHPYILGAWLGDGSSADGRIHGIDREIFQKITDLGYKVKDTSRVETKSVLGIKVLLREIGVLNNKHIPEEYKIGSIEQRMELIRGLMDTDGTADKKNRCIFTNINKTLCEDLYEVLISVGIKASMLSFVSQEKGENYVFHTVEFAGRKEKNPFFLKRKAERIYIEKKPQQRYITDIRPLRDGEHLTNCIQVDAKDGIYLAGKELIPTHNSTLITFALRLWKLIKRPEITQAIFSNSIKIARPHFNLIKRTCEKNTLLKKTWPHIFWADPQKTREASWSIESGLFFKTTAGKDPGLGAFGLIDSMPTGGHFNEKVTDDLVDLNNVGTQFMIDKVREAFEMSDNLGSAYGGTVDTVIGTRYRYGDLYEHLEKMGTYRISKIAAEVNDKGEPLYGGYPVFMSKEVLDIKKKKQKNNYYAQMLQTPLQEGSAAFKLTWLVFKDFEYPEGKYYIVADAATDPQLAKKPDSIDFTVYWLIKTQPGRKIRIIDCVKDKMSIKEKWQILKQWHMEYEIEECAYEEYGTQKDRGYFLEKMEEERFYFNIRPLRENKEAKPTRIGILAEYFAEGRIIFPKSLTRMSKFEGVVDIVADFIDEYKKYPLVTHDDMLDSLSKISEMDLIYPLTEEFEEPKYEDYRPSPLEEDYSSTIECYWGDL
jgi:phage terminase large subunit-like protein